MSIFDHGEYRIAEIAEAIVRKGRTALHRKFGEHLADCAAAAEEMERVLSGDGYGDEGNLDALIRKVLPSGTALESAIEEAHLALKALQIELDRSGRGRAPKPVYYHGAHEAK